MKFDGADTSARVEERQERGYRRLGASSVAFQVATYDHRKPLVIDSTLSYSTYLGEYFALPGAERNRLGAWQQLLMARAKIRFVGSCPSDGSSQRRYGNTTRGEIKRANPGAHDFVSVVVGQIARELNVSLCDIRARWGVNRA